MYLKRVKQTHGFHYTLCESFWDKDCWRHRELMDLGPHPGDHIEYPGGNSFYINEEVEESLLEQGAGFTSHELEKLFLPFLDPHIRRIVRNFTRSRGPSGGRWAKYSQEEMIKRHQALHSFDKRRLHYIRCGRVHIGNLDARPWKFLNVLLEKSRDEIETLLEDMEQVLNPHEIRPFLYTALHLQSRFASHPARHQPAALDPERVDDYFVEALCRLNLEPDFFRGVEDHDPEVLHPYLVRYLILYFDSAFDQGSVERDYVKDFIWKHRFYRPPQPAPRPAMAEQEACRRLGLSHDRYKAMDSKSLSRHYRKKAMDAHPDKGGDHESFIKIREAYKRLLTEKASGSP